MTCKANVEIKYVPDYAFKYQYWIININEGSELTFYSSFDSRSKAETVLEDCQIIVENPNT